MAKARSTIKILIADDHAIFRDALRKLLDLDKEITIVGEARNGAECIEKLGELKPHILLLDIRMPDKSGLAVLGEVNCDTLPTRVIVLTAAEDDRDVIRAIRLGARGVVLKDSAIELLVKCIHRVHAGEIWLDGRMTAEVVNAFSAPPKFGARNERLLLSDREMEVVHLVAKGFQNKEIGTNLGISMQTVKNHLLSIYDKLGVSGRLELMLYAIHHHLVDEPNGTLAQKSLSPRTPK